MRTRLFSSIALLTLLGAAAPLSASRAHTLAAPVSSTHLAIDHPAIDPSLLVEGVTGGPLATRTGFVKVVIELADAPTATVYASRAGKSPAQASGDAKRQLATIERTQRTLVAELQSARIGATVLYRTQRVYNGIGARVERGKLSEIAKLPGVKALHPLVSKRLSNSASVPLVGAPQFWSFMGGGRTGKGIAIGVIDTGIDYLHTDFGGAGTDAAYHSNDPTANDDSAFPTAKVVGGYDFVGDAYDAGDPAADTPAPDPDPLDCNGHGSHVSGTAAGYGVNADGTTYTGSYTTITPFDSFKIGPGVAPEANLYALKVFGCEGSTDVTDAAIEWAVDPNGDGDFSDHLDVINMSLGSNFGSPGDSTVVATDNAALVGVIAAVAAGNDGDTYYIMGGPGAAARAVTVAGSVDKRSVVDGFRVNVPPSIAGVKPASQSVAYDWSHAPVTANLVYPPTQRTGCQAFSDSNKALITGNVVLLDWSELSPGTPECGSVTRGTNAVAAGAVGFLLADNTDVFDLLITGSATIPGYSIPRSIGQTLKTTLASEPVSVTLSGEYANTVQYDDTSIVDTLYTSSSRGPRMGDSALKPDLAAPAVTVFSAAALTGNDGASFNGTSMATPHVAGGLALLKQLHPDWSVEELKALVMNTAGQDVRMLPDINSTEFGPQRVGTGRMQLNRAVNNHVVAFNADDSGFVGVSFGDVEVVGEKTLAKNIRVENKGTANTSYSIQYRPEVDMPGVSFSVSPASITVAPGQSANVVVTMTANASAMNHARDTTVTATQGPLARHWISEESGRVVLTPTSGVALRVPVYTAARAASNMQAATSTLDFGTNTTASDSITLRGDGVGTDTALTTNDGGIDQVSLISAFELKLRSSNETASGTDVDDADLQYVGVAADFSAIRPVTETGITFGLSTYRDWTTPQAAYDVEFDIYIDTDRDGTDDYVLFNWDYASATGSASQSDVLITFLVNLNEPNAAPKAYYLNGVAPSTINTVPYNTNVLLMPVDAADLGLSNSNSAFNFHIATFDPYFDGPVDRTPVMSYDVAQPGVTFTDGNIVTDLPGVDIPIDFSQPNFRAGRSQGVLLLHHYNTTTNRAEVVTINAQFPQKVYLPLAAGQPNPGGAASR